MVPTHEHISQNPTFGKDQQSENNQKPIFQGKSRRVQLGETTKGCLVMKKIAIPERSTRRRNIHSSEPANALSFRTLTHLEYVLNITAKRTFNVNRIRVTERQNHFSCHHFNDKTRS